MEIAIAMFKRPEKRLEDAGILRSFCFYLLYIRPMSRDDMR